MLVVVAGGGGGGCSNDSIFKSLLLHVFLAVQPRGIPAHILREIRQADIAERNTTRIVAAIEALGSQIAGPTEDIAYLRRVCDRTGLPELEREALHERIDALCNRLDGMQEALSTLQTTVNDLRHEQRELFESGGAAPRPAVDHVGGDAGPRSPVPPAPPAPPQQAEFNPRTYEIPSAMNVPDAMRRWFLGFGYVLIHTCAWCWSGAVIASMGGGGGGGGGGGVVGGGGCGGVGGPCCCCCRCCCCCCCGCCGCFCCRRCCC
jgi:hypothetical protein